MPKKIYRDWKDKLPLWSVYGLIGASLAAVLIFVAPEIGRFLHKLDWAFFATERYLYLRWILLGLVVTLRISAISMVFALILGTLVAVGRLSHSRIARILCIPYIEFFRNTPLLIQLFFWYFGTSTILDALASAVGLAGGLLPGPVQLLQGWILAVKEMYNKGHSEFISGVIGLTVYTSAFIAETVRAGIQAIPHGQTEAGRASGLSVFQTLWSIILPQAFRIIIPPLLSQFLALTKNSAQAMAIGVAEVTYMARQVEANTFKGFEAFTVATGLYMVISFLMSYLLNRYNAAISIAEMTRKKQRLITTRSVPVGYRLGGVFAAFASISGALVFFRGGQLVAAGDWMPGCSLYAVGVAASASAAVALKRPTWGVGFIKGVLALGAVAAFFDLLGRLEAGLSLFENPVAEIYTPLARVFLFGMVTAFWWVYFNRREVIFMRGGGR